MRKLTNSLFAGQFASFLLTELLFLLNPQVPHTWANVVSVVLVFGATYGLTIGLAYWLLLQAVELLRGRSLGPAWLSFRVSTWLLMLSLAGAASLLWYNLVTLRLYLPIENLRALAIAATVVTTAAGALLVQSLFHFSFGARGLTISYLVTVLSLTAAVSLPLVMRPQPAPPESWPRMPLEDNALSKRLTVIGIEGASMSYVLPAIAEGGLPNFARLIEGGASGALRTLYPTESLPVWTSIATGKLPRQHGLKGFYRYRFPGVESHFALRPRGLDLSALDFLGVIDRSAVTSSLRQTQPFWSILSRFGVKVGLVRWWGSYPAEPVEGFIVSEFLHRQVRENFEPPLPDLTYPPELFDKLSSIVVFPQQIEDEMLARFVDQSVHIPGDTFPWRSTLTRALADDLTYHEIGTRLRQEEDPEVFAIYFFGLDVMGHFFTRFHLPERFGDVSDLEIRKYGRAIDAYYLFLDSLVGEYLQVREPNETIVLVSGHGVDALPLSGRIIEPFKGNPYLSGQHESSPDGLLILNGPDVTPNSKILSASVLDITPTLLYLMGLPLGQDMDGTLLTEILEEDLMREQPVTFISSYHNFLVEPRRSRGALDGISALDALPDLLENPEE